MKNNKGFTLIEAIAVTMLLAMLALIIIPNVLNQRRKQEKKIKEQQKKIMYIEAERYLKENNLVEASSTKCIPVTFLEKEGYINLNTTTYDSQYIKLIIDEDENIESSLVNTCSDQVINKVTVTFDANGGTVDTTSKEVLVGKKYGDLPTPTRSGYTFKGWNGKNKLNYDTLSEGARSSQLDSSLTVDNDGYVSDLSPNSDNRGWAGKTQHNWHLDLDSGTYSLKLFFKTRINNTAASSYTGMRIYGDDSILITAGKSLLYDKDSYEGTFTINKKTDIGIIIKAYNGVYRIQLEEGNKATEYEPYYVTKNTKVTQTGNHTLTAIWKANET